MLLLHSQEVSTPQKKALKKVLFYFINVDAVNPYRIEWSKIKYHRNNATYKLLINICYLVTCGMLLSEQEGSKKLSKFVDDKQMHSLYERFIRHYYRKHYPAYSVSAAQIAWNVDDGIIDFLPEMDSDVTIQHGSKALIIDAKYYNKTMHINNRFGNKTLHSGNLYQIFTYVKNKDTTNSGNVSGVLLYAKTDEEITPDCEYLMSGNRIGVKTLDLGADFANIMEQLDLLVEKYF